MKFNRKFLIEKTPVVASITTTLDNMGLSAEEGQIILAWILGLSLGGELTELKEGRSEKIDHAMETVAAGMAWALECKQKDRLQ